jgi:flagellar FliL protein
MASADQASDSNMTPISDAKPRSGKKIALLVAALLLVSAGGGAAWWFTRSAPDSAHAEKLNPLAPSVFVELEPFTVNLAGDRVLQTTMSLQLANAEDEDQLKLYQPVVKSRMLMLLSSKSAEVLQAPQCKEALAAEIAAALKQPYVKGLTPPAIGGVFLTAFVIQ